jgi:hypothetical protein
MSPKPKTLFLGQVVATHGALHAFALADENYLGYLMRHARGDWGEVCPEDARANDLGASALHIQAP